MKFARANSIGSGHAQLLPQFLNRRKEAFTLWRYIIVMASRHIVQEFKKKRRERKRKDKCFFLFCGSIIMPTRKVWCNSFLTQLVVLFKKFKIRQPCSCSPPELFLRKALITAARTDGRGMGNSAVFTNMLCHKLCWYWRFHARRSQHVINFFLSPPVLQFNRTAGTVARPSAPHLFVFFFFFLWNLLIVRDVDGVLMNSGGCRCPFNYSPPAIHYS